MPCHTTQPLGHAGQAARACNISQDCIHGTDSTRTVNEHDHWVVASALLCQHAKGSKHVFVWTQVRFNRYSQLSLARWTVATIGFPDFADCRDSWGRSVNPHVSGVAAQQKTLNSGLSVLPPY